MSNSLPLKCGPECPLYNLKNSTCKLTGQTRKTREACEFGYDLDNAKNLSENKPYNKERTALPRERS